MHSILRSVLPSTLLALTAVACSNGGGGSGSTLAAREEPTAAIAWFDLLYDTIRTEALSPPVASRIIGYTGVAAYEAVLPGMPDHRSLGGQLNDLDPLPDLASGGHHWPTVLNAAVAATLSGLLPAASAPTMQAIADLEQAQLDALPANLSQAVIDRSIARGQEVAAHVLAWSMTDGYDVWNNCAYTPPTGEGLWEPTPPMMAPALQPCWGRLRPFVLLFGAECPALAPPPYSTDPGSVFYTEALEVYDTVNALTQDQLDIAQFWADNPGQTGTPPGH